MSVPAEDGAGVLVLASALPAFAAYPPRWVTRSGKAVEAHRSEQDAVEDARVWREHGRSATVHLVPLAPDGLLVLLDCPGMAARCSSTRWVADGDGAIADGAAIVAALSGAPVAPWQRVWPAGDAQSVLVEWSQRAWLSQEGVHDGVDGFRVECSNPQAGHEGACRFRDWSWDWRQGLVSAT